MDVTTDPALAQQYAPPIYTEPLRDLLNPLQIEGSWTGELESGMAEYEGRLQNTRDTIAAREAWKKGDRQTWEAILARNPNVGIEGTKFERAEDGRWRVLYTFSAWGGDAAKFLGVLSRELIAGRWMDAAQGEIYLAHPPDKEWNAPLRGKQKTIVDNTIKDADELLSNNNCASAVTGLTTSVESSPQAQEVLRTVRFRYSGVAPGAVATTEGNNDTGRRANVAYIGIYDVFFKDKVLQEAYARTFGIEGYSINQLRVLAILHELRHTFTGPHRGATFQETVAENNQWNQTILAACFGTNKTRARNK
jgi:hypothetical protein